MKKNRHNNEKIPLSNRCNSDQDPTQQKKTAEDAPSDTFKILTKETPTKLDSPITQEEIDALLKNHKKGNLK